MNPFNKQSIGITGSITAFAAFILVNFVGFDEGSATKLIVAIVEVAGILMAWYGRGRVGDVSWFGRRK